MKVDSTTVGSIHMNLKRCETIKARRAVSLAKISNWVRWAHLNKNMYMGLLLYDCVTADQ